MVRVCVWGRGGGVPARCGCARTGGSPRLRCSPPAPWLVHSCLPPQHGCLSPALPLTRTNSHPRCLPPRAAPHPQARPGRPPAPPSRPKPPRPPRRARPQPLPRQAGQAVRAPLPRPSLPPHARAAAQGAARGAPAARGRRLGRARGGPAARAPPPSLLPLALRAVVLLPLLRPRRPRPRPRRRTSGCGGGGAGGTSASTPTIALHYMPPP